MSQLNFFLTQDEIILKVQAILTMGNFFVFNGEVFDSTEPVPVSDVSQIEGFQTIILWLKSNRKAPLASMLGTGDFAGKFLFDYLKDPIIEIENCRYSGGLFTPGRIYYKAGWIDDEELRNMHEKAGKKLLGLFDENTIKVKKLWRVSPDVKELIMQGNELELGSNGFRINKANIDAA